MFLIIRLIPPPRDEPLDGIQQFEPVFQRGSATAATCQTASPDEKTATPG